MNEFVCRFNRRRSHSRGMIFYRVPIELAVDHRPVRCRDLIVNKQPGKTPPAPPWPREAAQSGTPTSGQAVSGLTALLR